MVAKLGSEFQVNTYTLSTQDRPAIAVDGNNGNFIITWVSLNQDGDDFGIYAQRFDNTGTPLGSEFRVNTYTTTEQDSPHIVADAVGNFIITWTNRDQDGNTFEINAQRYDNTGTPVGSEFRVNTYTDNNQSNSAIAINPANGNFIITWNSDGQDGSLDGIYAQRFDVSGTPLGLEFPVNTYTTNTQNFPRIAAGNGNFLITWNSYNQDGDNFGIYGQLYDVTGTPLGSEFQVNTYTNDIQFRPDIASDSNGNFITTWQSLGQDGSSFGIYAQRYDNPVSPSPKPKALPKSPKAVAPPTPTPSLSILFPWNPSRLQSPAMHKFRSVRMAIALLQC